MPVRLSRPAGAVAGCGRRGRWPRRTPAAVAAASPPTVGHRRRPSAAGDMHRQAPAPALGIGGHRAQDLVEQRPGRGRQLVAQARRARSSLRYWRPRPGSAGSARRGARASGSSDRRLGPSAGARARTQVGNVVTPHERPPRRASAVSSASSDGSASRTGPGAAGAGPGGGGPWPPTRRCPARRRWPRGAGRRRRAAPRRPAAWAAAPAGPPSSRLASRDRVQAGLGIDAGPWRRRSGRSSSSSSWRCRVRRPSSVEAQLAVIRYSQVVNWASPRKRSQAPVGPQVRLLHHVPSVLLVAGEAERQRVGVEVGDAHQLVEGVPVATAGRGDQADHLVGPSRPSSDPGMTRRLPRALTAWEDRG